MIDKFIKLISFFFISIFFFSYVRAQGVGVGISTYSIVLNGSILDYYTVTPKIINPSNYEIKVKVYFDCKNCVSDVKIFGYKMGEKIDDYRSYFTLDKDDITIPPQSYGDNAPEIRIIFSPKFITKKNLKIYTPEFFNFFVKVINKNYQNSLTIPYLALFIGEKNLNGLLIADVYESSFGTLGVTPSVGASLDMTAKGMPLSSFIILVLLIVLIIIFILNKFGFNFKKIFKRKK